MTTDILKIRYRGLGAFRSFVVGFCVFSLGSVLAGWLNQHNIHGSLAFLDNILSGIVAGLAALVYEHLRQREIEKKLQTIRLMNHHVRNALQIICAVPSSPNNTEEATMFRDAVRRIEWALGEVLPGEGERGELVPTPKVESPEKKSVA